MSAEKQFLFDKRNVNYTKIYNLLIANGYKKEDAEHFKKYHAWYFTEELVDMITGHKPYREIYEKILEESRAFVPWACDKIEGAEY